MSIITVNNTNDNGAGSLRDALVEAESGDTIAFASKLAGKKITLTSGELIIKKDLTIDGAGAPNLTLSGNNSSRVFSTAVWIDVTLKNLTIRDGKNEGKGGGVRIGSNSNLTVDNVKFYENEAGQGGGIHVGFKSDLTVLNSTFEKNDGTLTGNGFSAGAIATDNGGSVVVKNSKFTENKGVAGGAMYVSLSSLIVENSIFLNNKAKGGGGAIFTDGANISGPRVNDSTVGGIIRISDSWFEGNSGSGVGGGLYLYIYNPDKAIVENSTIIDNTVYADHRGIAQGGGLRGNGNLTIRNVTIANNVAEGQGGGLWLDGDTTSNNATINIENTTLSGNKATTDKGLGGAIAVNPPADAEINIRNSTIADNYAEKSAGGFWAVGKQKPTLTNSIIVNNSDPANTGQQVAYQLKDGGGNIEYPGPLTTKAVKVTANSLVADPKLGKLQNIDGVLVRPLLAGSPAINAGVGGATKVDARSIARDSEPDVGAFEYAAKKSSVVAINGSAEADTLTGSSKNDRITGSQGADKLTGGAGSDLFVYTSIRDAGDTITDFDIGQDKIVLTQLLDNLFEKDYTGTNAIADGYVKVVQGASDNNFKVQIDADGPNDEGSFRNFITVNTIGTGTLNKADNFVF
ncbi:choice-of-anchor Q domain-containing protein [Nostoc sp. UHCC 0302]|uniref:choice-of-anchor Q domain-containing protein n=1 Tax=Nostoc sp. UHCC 0302 TaxID=3134896 RepID=UPI00311CD9DD